MIRKLESMLIASVALLLLASCGGGGGGNTPEKTPADPDENSPPDNNLTGVWGTTTNYTYSYDSDNSDLIDSSHVDAKVVSFFYIVEDNDGNLHLNNCGGETADEIQRNADGIYFELGNVHYEMKVFGNTRMEGTLTMPPSANGTGIEQMDGTISLVKVQRGPQTTAEIANFSLGTIEYAFDGNATSSISFSCFSTHFGEQSIEQHGNVSEFVIEGFSATNSSGDRIIVEYAGSEQHPGYFDADIGTESLYLYQWQGSNTYNAAIQDSTLFTVKFDATGKEHPDDDEVRTFSATLTLPTP